MKKLLYLCSITIMIIAWQTNADAGGPWNDQYCNIETKTLVKKDNSGKIIDQQAMEKVVCDDGVKDFLVYSGIAKECREFWFEIILNNKRTPKRGYVCQKFDGSWEIVHNPN